MVPEEKATDRWSQESTKRGSFNESASQTTSTSYQVLAANMKTTNRAQGQESTQNLPGCMTANNHNLFDVSSTSREHEETHPPRTTGEKESEVSIPGENRSTIRSNMTEDEHIKSLKTDVSFAQSQLPSLKRQNLCRVSASVSSEIRCPNNLSISENVDVKEQSSKMEIDNSGMNLGAETIVLVPATSRKVRFATEDPETFIIPARDITRIPRRPYVERRNRRRKKK